MIRRVEVEFALGSKSLSVTRTIEYVIPEQVQILLVAMAAARGERGDAMRELRWQLAGAYDRPLARRDDGLLDLAMALETFEEEHVELRLERFCQEAVNEFASAAWVLEAALSSWGWLIEGAVTSVSDDVLTMLPTSAEALGELLAPWRAQLDEGGLPLFERAVACARALDGAGCRKYAEEARATMAPFVDDPAQHQSACLCAACGGRHVVVTRKP